MRRLRKSVRKKILFGILCVAVQLVLIFVCRITVKQVVVKKYEGVLEEKNAILEAAGRMVCITKKEVRAGEVFTEDNTEKRYVLSEQNPEALASDVIGMTSCADMPAGVIINTSLCSKQACAPSERKCVFRNIRYSECFSAYDAVDVRIRYANGENYCVLKKKRLQKNEEDEKACCFFLTEEEQLLMSAAQYDVDVYEGAELYMVGFMEERLQEDAISAYLPSVQVVSQLRQWNEEYRVNFETWCELRTALELRLAEHRKQRLEGLL